VLVVGLERCQIRDAMNYGRSEARFKFSERSAEGGAVLPIDCGKDEDPLVGRCQPALLVAAAFIGGMALQRQLDKPISVKRRYAEEVMVARDGKGWFRFVAPAPKK
jgi:hypothetical protein